jgi:hypothetical protein
MRPGFSEVRVVIIARSVASIECLGSTGSRQRRRAFCLVQRKAHEAWRRLAVRGWSFPGDCAAPAILRSHSRQYASRTRDAGQMQPK